MNAMQGWEENTMMKRIMSLMLALVLTFNLIQVSSVSYATELNETNKDENSYVETTDDNAVSSGLTNDMTITSTNSIGTMLQSELTDVVEEQEQNDGYNIFSVEVEGTEAIVEYEAVEDCHLVVSIYDNEGNQMIGSGATDVSATETEVTVAINIDSMPTYFYTRAYLVEKDTLMPLCQEYKSELYTQAMQEFLAKTPEDFDPEKVLEIEEESNSFVVFSEATQIIPYNADYNTIEQMDETNRKYIIANPDEKFSALEVGDVFSYEYEDGHVLIVDIATIENQENKLVITGNEVDMGEVFEYVRIDTDFSVEDSTVDPSTCDEGVTYLGSATSNEEVEIANVNMQGVQTYALQRGTDTEVSAGRELKFEVGEKDSNGNIKGLYGSLAFKAAGVFKVYEAPDAEYVELRIDVTINGIVEFAKEIEENYDLARIAFAPAPGVTISFTPQIIFEAKAAIKYEAEVKFVIGVKVEGDEVVNISKKPKITHKLAMEGTVFIGISLEPSIDLIHECVFDINLTAKTGVEFKLESTDKFTNESKGIQHDCEGCFEGDISLELDISGSIQLASIKFLTYNVDILNIKSKISDMYVSISHGEFGLEKCPHLKYRVTAMVVDTNNFPFEGVTVCDEYETDADGMVEFYLKRGKYRATAKKDGYIVNANTLDLFEIKDKEKLAYFIMIPDPNAGGSGSGKDEDPTEEEEPTEEEIISDETFPDANFLQYVMEEIDVDGNGELSNSEIMSTTWIDCSSLGISDLSGIELFTELSYLNCSSNNLTKLDVSKNTELYELICYSNKLTSLAISNNTNLMMLECGDNNINALDVSKNTNLEELWCSGNNISILNVSNNFDLLKLGCGDNNINTLDLNNNTELVELACDGNELANLNVSNNIKLRYLNCENNKLTNLDVSKNTQLWGLHCDENDISALDLENNTELMSLSCDECSIQELDLSHNTNLDSVFCSDNLVLCALNIQNCEKLTWLSCGGNNLPILDLSTNVMLEWVNVSDNTLSEINVNKCESLTTLACDGNKLTQLDVSGCKKIESLACSDNELYLLNTNNCSLLSYLRCDNNKLTNLNLKDNINLDGIDCSDNLLESLDLSNNFELTWIYCDHNQFKSIDVTNNTKLYNLSCDDEVEVIGYNTASDSVTEVKEVAEILETSSATTSTSSNTYKDEPLDVLLEANLITSTATDTQNSYTGLYSNEVYNFYVFQDAPQDIPFGSVFTENNLLYVKQYVSDENGSLNIEYSPVSDNTDATEVLVCAQKIDIANGYEISVDDLIYNGTKQTPAVCLYVHDELLVGGRDFNIEGDTVVSEVGQYTLSLVGIGKYAGVVEVTFSVVGDSVVPVTSIVLNKTALKLAIGEQAVLSATVTPNDAIGKSVTWKSSNPKVATVDANGKVTAIAEGTANIIVTATDGSGVETQCVVTVTKKQEATQQPTTEQQPEEKPTTTEQSSTQSPTTQQPATTKTLPKVGTKKTLSGAQYKVTKSTSKTKEVIFVKPSSNKKTSFSVPATVKIDGYTYKVTAIADKAFKNNKKIKSVIIGKNVKKIGKEAFRGCKKLKKITIKSEALKSVGKNAIKNIDKKATIKVPKKQYSKYKKLFKSKTGYKKTMKIKK